MKNSINPVEKGLRELGEEVVEPGHFHTTMAAVRTKIESYNPMNRILKNSAWIGGLVVTAIVVMTLIPAAYEVRVGTLLKTEFTLPEGVIPGDIVEATRDLGEGRKMISVDNGVVNFTYATTDKIGADISSAIRNAFNEKLPGLDDIEFTSEPIVEKRGGNALAAVTGGKIAIGCKNMTDAEIENAIAGALTSLGLDVRQVSVSTTSPGEGQIERRIEIRAECDSATAGQDLMEFEFQFDDDHPGEIHRQKQVTVRKSYP